MIGSLKRRRIEKERAEAVPQRERAARDFVAAIREAEGALEALKAAMFARAAELAKELGCTPEQALAKRLTSDPELRDFAAASEVARSSAYAVEVRKRHAAA